MQFSAILLSFAALLAASNAFSVLPSLTQQKCSVTAKFVSLNQDYVDRARDCASTFGKCDISELRQLKDELYKERVQGVLFGETGHAVTEDEVEYHMLEEELSLQLQLLQTETPSPALFLDMPVRGSLFPEMEDKMPELPHLKDNTSSSDIQKKLKDQQDRFWMVKMWEEGVVDSLEFCALIALAGLVPAIIFN